MLNLKMVSWSLGIFAGISFVVCVIYGLVVPASLHAAQALEAVLPAFKWLTFGGFVLGLLESFLYGAYAGLVFVPIYNTLYRRWGAAIPGGAASSFSDASGRRDPSAPELNRELHGPGPASHAP
jgi:hypothetical protein